MSEKIILLKKRINKDGIYNKQSEENVSEGEYERFIVITFKGFFSTNVMHFFIIIKRGKTSQSKKKVKKKKKAFIYIQLSLFLFFLIWWIQISL